MGEQAPHQASEQEQVTPAEAYEGNNAEYLEQHPNAVTDRDKAEFMAHASKEEEEAYVSRKNEASDIALRAIQKATLEDNTLVGTRHPDSSFAAVDKNIRHAKRAREVADHKAAVAADYFDRIKEV